MGAVCYSHETEVKFTEGILSSSGDWQWFVDCTESDFSSPGEISDVDEFAGFIASVRNPYVHFARIVDSSGIQKLSFATRWLSDVYDCVLVRSGLMRPEDCMKGVAAYDLLCICSFGTNLINRIEGLDSSALLDLRFIYYSNLHQLLDFGRLREEGERLIGLAEKIDLNGIDKALDIVKGNFGGIDVPVDESEVASLLDERFDADFMSFQAPVGTMFFQTWQESLLSDAFRTSYECRHIEPSMRMGSIEYPNVSDWTKGMLAVAKASFADDRAVCVMEVLEFAKFDQVPSTRSQEILVELAVGNAARVVDENETLRKMACTAFRVLEDLMSEKLLDGSLRGEYFKNLAALLSGISDYNELCFMRKHGLPCTKEQNDILRIGAENYLKNSFKAVASSHDLAVLLGDKRNAKCCDQEGAELLLELFRGFVKTMDVETAELFRCAMIFFIELLGNECVDVEWTKGVIISLRHTWQDGYYNAVVAGMQVFSQKVPVSPNQVDEINEAFIKEPCGLAHAFFLQSDEAIASILEGISEHVFVHMFSKTTISEYYPIHARVSSREDDRSIDNLIISKLRKVYEKYSYRFVNALDEQVMVDAFYERLKLGIRTCLPMIAIQPAYTWVIENAPKQYELLPFPDGRPTMGHLTQLFPVLETVIREYGELFNIVPFQADKDSYTKLKDVSTVLADLVQKMSDMTGALQGSNEFLFVHFIMYSPNGFNVRNDCIHGRQYQDSAGVAAAFHMTVICVYMILKRLRELESYFDDDGM